jgi:hypothetical protein
MTPRDDETKGVDKHSEREPNQPPVDGPSPGSMGQEDAGHLGSSSQDRPKGTKTTPDDENGEGASS